MRAFLALVAVAAMAWGAAAQPSGGANLDRAMPYQARRTSPVTYEVDFSAVVTPPYHTKTLKVWMPIPQTDAGQEASPPEFGTFPMTVAPKIGVEPVYGNKFAYFDFDHPEGAQIIRQRYNIRVWELHWDVDPSKVVAVQQWPAGFDPFLKSEKQAVVLSEKLQDIARQIVPQRGGEAQDLTQVMDWVNSQMKYDHDAASLQASSEHALANRKGHCSDYHGLCAALGRALGYPTRVTYGINPFPKNSPSHCKLEAYLPPYGWVSFDVSETQRLIEGIQKDKELRVAQKEQLLKLAGERLTRGFRDNTWYALTRGTDYDLAPPAAKKAAVVRTIYAEADGVALPEPDPANKEKREWAWMTVHKYVPDRAVPYPFKDWQTLVADTKEQQR